MRSALQFLFYVSLSLATKGENQPLKILFIGNSFMYNHDMVSMERGLTEAAGIDAYIGTHYSLGQSLNYFIKDTSCWNIIRSKQWDYIVLQDNQLYYCDSVGKLDSMGSKLPVLHNNLVFQDSIKKLIPCVKIIYFAGWEKNGGFPQRFPGDNTDKMISRILANYSLLNNMPGVHNIIAPVGVAWIKGMEDRGELAKDPFSNYSLYDDDGRHPEIAGSYLAACVLFATIFRQSPEGLHNISFFSGQKFDSFIKKISWCAIVDSFAYSNLQSVVPKTGIRDSVAFTSKRYKHYQWYKNNTQIPGASSYAYKLKDNSAFYAIEVTDSKGCLLISFPIRLRDDGQFHFIHDSR